jgi:hypothetical protein
MSKQAAHDFYRRKTEQQAQYAPGFAGYGSDEVGPG